VHFLLERLIDGIAQGVVHPTVVGAADTVLFRNAVHQRESAMSAVAREESQAALAVFEQHQVLAEDGESLRRLVLELRARSDGLPVTPQELAHGFVVADDLGQEVVLLGIKHGQPPAFSVFFAP
jgi:hypothetical protein